MTRTDATHPIGDDLLMGYATGRLPVAYDMLVACAVSLDDAARVRLSAFEALGGALLARGEVARLRSDSMEAVLARIRRSAPEDTVAADAKAARRRPVLPQPLRAALGGDVDAVRWAERDGLRVAEAAADGGGVARLVELPEGRVLDHAFDTVLVLAGACYAGVLRLGQGDVAEAGAAATAPVADAGGPCLLLAVEDAPMPARDWIPRAVRRLRVFD